jgi:hypothetical protein
LHTTPAIALCLDPLLLYDMRVLPSSGLVSSPPLMFTLHSVLSLPSILLSLKDSNNVVHTVTHEGGGGGVTWPAGATERPVRSACAVLQRGVTWRREAGDRQRAELGVATGGARGLAALDGWPAHKVCATRDQMRTSTFRRRSSIQWPWCSIRHHGGSN